VAGLPTVVARELEVRPEKHQWLIEGLWSDDAVGIIGGEPKCCKSFLALDVAVAVATGQPCLDRFAVARRGRVLLYAAEDALHVVRARLQGIALARGTTLDQLDIHVITVPSLRLDIEQDCARLRQTVAQLRPRLLVLDPFVRLHRRDENLSGEVAPLLAFLRDLQRRWSVSVIVVHHARKGAGSMRAGQALRGSSEFHAWGDSNLYLRRPGGGERISLQVEHRAAPPVGPLSLELVANDDALALAVLDTPAQEDAPNPQPADRVLAALSEAPAPLTIGAIRTACRMKNQTVGRAVALLAEQGHVRKTDRGYELITR